MFTQRRKARKDLNGFIFASFAPLRENIGRKERAKSLRSLAFFKLAPRFSAPLGLSLCFKPRCQAA